MDAALRRQAKREGRSLNSVALEALARGIGLEAVPVKYHDLDFAIGTWVEDAEIDKVIQEQDQVDPDLWK